MGVELREMDTRELSDQGVRIRLFPQLICKAFGAGLCLAGCASTAHTAVDRQLDIHSTLPEHTAFVDVCVEGGPSRRFVVMDHMYVLTGLPQEETHIVTVVLSDMDHRTLATTGQVSMLASFQTASLSDCDDAFCEDLCIVDNARPDVEGTGWTLALRFAESL